MAAKPPERPGPGSLGPGALVPYAAAALVLLGLRLSLVAEAVDLQVYDLVSWLRPQRSLRPEPLSLIGIGQRDIAAYGWPIDDQLLCQAIRRLSQEGAVAIGFDLWIGTTLPLAGLTLVAVAGWLRRGSASHEQRQQIEKLLGQSTSPAVARQLWEQRDTLLADGRFEGRQLPVTVIFTDLRNFTTVSESLSPAALLAWINRGMACCVPAITRRSGMVNKFTGDGVMAVFGAPLSAGPEQDARDALASLLEIRAGMEALNHQLAAEGAPAMRMRLGVHSGMVLAGSMGSSERLEYAISGDAVNGASRIEGLEKDRHDGLCRILVSGHTFALLDPEGRSDDGLVWERWEEF